MLLFAVNFATTLARKNIHSKLMRKMFNKTIKRKIQCHVIFFKKNTRAYMKLGIN